LCKKKNPGHTQTSTKYKGELEMQLVLENTLLSKQQYFNFFIGWHHHLTGATANANLSLSNKQHLGGV
jgi:hypothetical protein